jgi:hypothetical protein
MLRLAKTMIFEIVTLNASFNIENGGISAHCAREPHRGRPKWPDFKTHRF